MAKAMTSFSLLCHRLFLLSFLFLHPKPKTLNRQNDGLWTEDGSLGFL